MKVWLWMCRQCAGMPLCQLEFVRTCEWDYVVISTIWGAFARGIKTIGFRQCLYSKASWPGGSRLLLSSSRGYSTASALLSGCCAGLSAPGSLAEASTVHMSRLHPVCMLCHSVGHVSNQRGGKALAPADSCSFQPRLPKPQIPSQCVFSARMHKPTPHKAWGLITKRRENQNWLLIELPGWMLMATTKGYFIPWEWCSRDWKYMWKWWRLEAVQTKLYMGLWMQTSNNMFFDSIGIVRHHICVYAAIQEW